MTEFEKDEEESWPRGNLQHYRGGKCLPQTRVMGIDVKWFVNRDVIGEFFASSSNVSLLIVGIHGFNLSLNRPPAKRSRL